MKVEPARRIVIIGGVTAGVSAATRARRTDEDAEITIFEQGPYASFAGCGLPYYVGGEVRDVNDLLCLSSKDFHTRYRIRVGLGQEVIAIDRTSRRVRVKDLATGDRGWHPFDSLILAHAGPPLLPPILGTDLHGVFSLSTVPDAEALRSHSLSDEVHQAAVIGGGLNGFAAMEALLGLGLEVHLVESAPHLMPHMDWEMATPLADHLRIEGVKLHLGAEAIAFAGNARLERLELSTGEAVSVQLAVVTNGMRRELGLAREAGLEIGPNGGVVVDDRMRTSDASIFACGDMAEVVHRVSGQRVRLSLPGPANREGRVAGSNAAGGDLRFPGVVGTSVIKARHLSAGKTGLSEGEAREAGFDSIVTYTHNHSIADYMREAEIMTIKLVAESTSGRLLGAQIVGGAGVDKRTDVLAMAIQAGMTMEDLEGIDLACSSPYSSAKDPVAVAGFTAANCWRGEVETVSVVELARKMDAAEPVRIVDVRGPRSFSMGHIPGSEHIVQGLIRKSLNRFDPSETVVLICGVGRASYETCRLLKHHGLPARNLSGGFASWRQTYPDRIEVGLDATRPLDTI